MLNTTYKRVRKYLNGDPDKLCISGRKNSSRGSKLDSYKDTILQLLSEGKQYKEVLGIIKSKGYTGGYSILCEYCNRLEGAESKNSGKIKINRVFINRRDVFKYFWSDKEIDENYLKTLYDKYPELTFINECVKDFRNVYEQKSLELLHIFTERYKRCSISDLCSFANGLNSDLAAVENSVTSLYSNGISEGNNNRLKLIKRMMYGRAKLLLLRVKVLVPVYPNEDTRNCG
jgi:Transposase and inactivated derivatives